MKIFNRRLGILAAVMALSITLHAQPPSTGDPNQGAKPGEAPIAGIGILIAVGGLLGAKKIFDARKKN